MSTSQIVKKGQTVENKTIDAGESQYVYGTAISMKVKKGWQFVSGGGVALNTSLYCGYVEDHKKITGGQVLIGGGVAKKTVINNHGAQMVSAGGKAYAANVKNGGYQHVFADGKAFGTTVSAGGAQELHDALPGKGGLASGTIINGGKQVVRSGCSAIDTTVNAGGLQKIKDGGKAITTTVKRGGSVEVYKGAKILSATIDGNTLHLYSNGTVKHSGSESWVMVYDGATALNTTAISCGHQIVSKGGVASKTSLGRGGVETVYSGGKAVATTVGNGGCQKVRGGLTSSTVVMGGGEMRVSAGTARVVTVAKWGFLVASAGAVISAVTLQSGAKMNIASGNTLAGANTFTGATVIGGTASKRVALAKNAELTIGAKTDMAKFHLNAANASVTIKGAASKIASLSVNKSTTVVYDVSKLAAEGNTLMLSVQSENKQKTGDFSITVTKRQAIGTYELSNNILQDKGTEWTIKLGKTKLGTTKLNSTTLTNNGIVYALKASGTQINLSVALKAGKLLKGNESANTLTGSTNSDVFYGGKGNDKIDGKNGRDVVVYDKTAWGKDTILKTSGTMTLLFNGLQAKDIKQSLKNGTMTITKKSDANQTITVQGWSNATHNIVFDPSDMKAFNKWINGTTTTAQVTAARNEAFKKAGLAAA